MNKKTITIIIVVVVIISMPISYWLISPLFRTEVVNESLDDFIQPALEEGDDMVSEPMPSLSPQIVSEGKFVGLAGHNAQGTARIYVTGENYFVRFENDFKVTNGPDVFVGLGKDNEYDSSTQLAALKGNVGSQNYEIPSSININDYNEIWVWCRAFSVPFGKAELSAKTSVNTSSNNLDLSSQGLTQVSQDVFKKTNLTQLDVSYNNLTGALPAEIRQLKNLVVLDASNNFMTGVPAEIGQLSKLEVLNLSNNQLTGLPYELGNLKNLKTLNLSGNNYSQQDLEIIKQGLPADVKIIAD